MNFDRATGYAKQKDSLKKEFDMFLGSLPGYITLATVAPRDICRFLFLRTRMEKTRFTVMTVDILGKRESMSVDV